MTKNLTKEFYNSLKSIEHEKTPKSLIIKDFDVRFKKIGPLSNVGVIPGEIVRI